MKISLARWIRRWMRSEEHFDDLLFFRGIPVFQGLSARNLGRIMQAMQRRQYRTGEVLFTEGQVGRAVFIVRSGQVELARTLPEGHRRSLGVLGPGQIFGEMALLEQLPRSATATVIEGGEICLLYTATLDSLIRGHPVIGARIMRNIAVMLSALLRKTNRELEKRGQGVGDGEKPSSQGVSGE